MVTSLVDRFIHKYGRLPTEFDSDYLEMLRMSKYRVKDVPDVQPGKCANCGASKNDGRKYVDFGLHVDWYGAVFICSLCLKEVVSESGIFDHVQEDLRNAKAALITSKNMQEQGVEIYEKFIKTFREFEEYYASLHSLGNDSNVDSSIGVGADEATSKPTVTATKPRTVKSSPVPGSTNLPSLADLLHNDS
jgi:hypothetical protein